MKKVIRDANLYDDTYWILIVRVWNDPIRVKDDYCISKYAVGLPYSFVVMGILQGTEVREVSNVNTGALLVCRPTRFATSKQSHIDEILGTETGDIRDVLK